MKAMERDLPERNIMIFAPSLTKQEVGEKMREIDEKALKEEEAYETQALTRSYLNLISKNV